MDELKQRWYVILCKSNANEYRTSFFWEIAVTSHASTYHNDESMRFWSFPAIARSNIYISRNNISNFFISDNRSKLAHDSFLFSHIVPIYGSATAWIYVVLKRKNLATGISFPFILSSHPVKRKVQRFSFGSRLVFRHVNNINVNFDRAQKIRCHPCLPRVY